LQPGNEWTEQKGAITVECMRARGQKVFPAKVGNFFSLSAKITKKWFRAGRTMSHSFEPWLPDFSW
jgi:hypothetical protein